MAICGRRGKQRAIREKARYQAMAEGKEPNRSSSGSRSNWTYTKMNMSEPFLLGFGIIVLIVAWRLIVRKDRFDSFRDNLFDLRESVRQHYIVNGYGLEHETYAQLRLLISQIRFLEQASFASLGIARYEYQHSKDLRECIDDLFKNRFKTDDKKLEAFIKNTRIQAHRQTTGYLIFSSLAMTTMLCVLIPIAIIIAIGHKSLTLSKGVLGRSLCIDSAICCAISLRKFLH